MPLTAAKVKSAVKSIAKEAAERAKDEGKIDEISDIVFEEVDAWWSEHLGTGRLDSLPPYPESTHDMALLKDAATVMQACDDAGWGVQTDSGLWEGMAEKSPWSAVLAQAYHTLEQAVGIVAYELTKE